MTITTQPARNEYTATAGQTIFNYTFRVYDSTDLQVFVTPSGQEANDSLYEVTGFAVTGVGSESGGTITLVTPASAGDEVTIISDIPSNRTTDYQNNGDFIPETVNEDFDRTVSLQKQSEDLLNRTLVSQKSLQNASPLSLPTPEGGKFVKWNSAEDGLENTSVISSGSFTTGTDIGDLVQLVDAGGGTPGWPAVDGSNLTDVTPGSGTVTSSQVATTSIYTGAIQDDAVTYAKIQNVVNDQRVLGNISGAGTVVNELTATEVRTLINVEDGADNTSSGAISKGWVRFDGTGTLSINDSYNVSSVIDNGTGNYTVVWDTAFTNSDYCAVATSRVQIGSAFSTFAGVRGFTTGTMIVEISSDGGASIDSEYVNVIAFGDM